MSFKLDYRIVEVDEIPTDLPSPSIDIPNRFSFIDKKKRQRKQQRDVIDFEEFVIENNEDLDNMWFELLNIFKQYRQIYSWEIEEIYSNYLNLVYDTYLLYH